MMSRRQTNILVGVLLLVGTGIGVYFSFRTGPEPADDRNRTVETQPASYKAPLVISVHANYPGANALTVAETVAAPIEQQVNGVENMLSMSSQSANDGSYTLQITFKEGSDLDMAQVQVQNRVALAVPVLPDVIKQSGIVVRKRSPQPLLLINLTSPDKRFDPLYLSNYASIQIKDELARLPGVADIVFYGQRDYGMRVWIDPERMATRQVTATDVVEALNQQNVRVAAGQVGQPPEIRDRNFQLTINTLGRLREPEQFDNIVVKTTADGASIRLKDVARVGLTSNEGSTAILNGKPVVLLAIHSVPNARPTELSRAVLDKLAELRTRAPDGLDLAVAFDFTPNLEDPSNLATLEHLVIDVQLPDAASPERTAEILKRSAEVLRKTPGVQDVLAVTEHPFALDRGRPCLIVRLTPKDQRDLGREQIAEKVRVALQNDIPEAEFRLSMPSTAQGFPVYGFPTEFAIEDRDDHGVKALQERVEALVEKLNRSGKISGAGLDSGLRGVPNLHLDIDRTQCQALGVEVSEVFKTLQVYLGSYYINDFDRFGRTWQVSVQVEPPFRDRPSDILKLQVKNKQNQPIQLGTFMAVRDTIGPRVIERHNMYPTARVVANLAEGASLAEARSLCEKMSEQELGTKQFKLIWRSR